MRTSGSGEGAELVAGVGGGGARVDGDVGLTGAGLEADTSLYLVVRAATTLLLLFRRTDLRISEFSDHALFRGNTSLVSYYLKVRYR